MEALISETTMATAPAKFLMRDTMAELLSQLGDLPPERVMMRPTPGAATEQDVIDLQDRENRNCELIDGTLVEKTIGVEESSAALWLGYYLINYLLIHDIGQAFGADAVMRLFPGQIRIPDLCFIHWERFPKEGLGPVSRVVPDLAVEILSKSNTRKEMDRKSRDYFESGVPLVWYVDPRKRTARVYTSPARSTLL